MPRKTKNVRRGRKNARRTKTRKYKTRGKRGAGLASWAFKNTAKTGASIGLSGAKFLGKGALNTATQHAQNQAVNLGLAKEVRQPGISGYFKPKTVVPTVNTDNLLNVVGNKFNLSKR